MISKISFGSIFKVKDTIGSEKFSMFRDYAQEQTAHNGINVEYNLNVESKPFISASFECKINAPDSMDDRIERFCKYHGIEYTKAWKQNDNIADEIKQRIIPNRDGKKIVEINSDKLEKLIQKQQSNIENIRYRYNTYYRNEIDSKIKKGGLISTTTLSIEPDKLTVEDLIDSINSNNGELSNKQVIIDFKNNNDNSNSQCMYFALKEMGIENIPMYIDENTHKIAQALDLTK